MKRFTILLVGFLALGSWGRTEDAKPAQDLASYLEKMQVKLEHTAQRANQPSSSGSSVVGLRGSKQESASKQLYWKGKTGAAPVTPEEVKMFRTALEQAKAGQKEVAIATLKSFMEKYPKSGLLEDADDTVKILSASPAPAKS